MLQAEAAYQPDTSSPGPVRVIKEQYEHKGNKDKGKGKGKDKGKNKKGKDQKGKREEHSDEEGDDQADIYYDSCDIALDKERTP